MSISRTLLSMIGRHKASPASWIPRAVIPGLSLLALMGGATPMLITQASHAQSIEYNQHGRRITYPNGEILYLGVSGDAIISLSNGTREYGYWEESGGAVSAHFPNRVIRLPYRGQSERISGYCILRGNVVPDRLCY